MRQASRVYLETQVTTTSQGQILIMLYDGAIAALTQAKELMEAKDYAGKGLRISKAMDILNELTCSLNPEKGGDLASNLSQLYFYCQKRLCLANSRMDTGLVDEVIKIIGGIRSAYAQIIDSPEAVAAMASAKPAVAAPSRTPVGVQSGPVNETTASKARARHAYGIQGTAASAEAEVPRQQAMVEGGPEVSPVPEEAPSPAASPVPPPLPL